MKIVRCRNEDINSPEGRCGNIVAILTDSQIAALKTDPEGGPIFRCRNCDKDQRWFQIVDTGAGPEFRVIDQPNERFDKLVFTEELIYHRVG
jgi:hypothetical protein